MIVCYCDEDGNDIASLENAHCPGVGETVHVKAWDADLRRWFDNEYRVTQLTYYVTRAPGEARQRVVVTLEEMA
jgi:hypothetical protein